MIVCEVGAIEYVQAATTAACAMVTVCPAIVSVPLRASPVFADTVNPTVAPPVPDAPLVIEIQLAFDTAVHAHAASVVTVAEPGPPTSGNCCDAGATAYEHGALWLTVNVCPPIVSVPVRAAPLFGATENATAALPLPDVLLEIVIQSAFDFAVHAQPVLVASARLPPPPADANDAVEGAIAYAHEMPACATEKVRPAIVSDPCRGAMAAFAATVKCTCPAPVPLAPVAIDSQSAFVVAVHAQPADTETDTSPLPLSAPKACDVGVMDASHDGPGGGGGAPAAAAACAMLIVWPAMSTVPVREGPPFGATLSVTAPFPVPLAPSATAIHSVWLAADHPQVPPDCTLTATVPPCAGTVGVAALTSNLHAGSWVMPTCVLLTSSIPFRCTGSVFAAIRNAADPSPWPLLPDVITIHATSLEAAHVQSRLVAIVSVPAPPDGGTDCVELVTLTVHFDPDGPATDTAEDVQDAAAVAIAHTNRNNG